MTSKNLRIHTVFIAILLLLSVLAGQLVNADNTTVPESVSQLLSGKTVDFSGVAGQIPEHRLPAALAAAGLLKFRALHGEISLSAKEAAAFEELLLARISSAKQIAFSQTEICHKKVEPREIMFDGQKLIVPEYFEADTALAITECRPKGEAGCLFPDFNIGIFSQTPLTDVKLVINGQIVDPGRIQMSQNESCFELLYRTPALSEAFLGIGTHTAEISIRNQAGEFVNKQWSFTVGIYDVSTPPLPDNAKVIGEINLSADKLFPGQKTSGSLCAVIYEDPSGKKYVEYCLTTPTGQIIKSRNLAFIGREMLAKRAAADDLTLSPKTSYAFIGNELNFSQTWAGSGKVLSVDWQINSGEVSTTETFIKMAGNTFAKCTVVIEDAYTDNAGNQTSFQYKISADKSIRALDLSANIFSNRMLQISSNATASFALKVAADCVVTYADGNELIQGDLAEGIAYSLGYAATLKVERLRWKIHVQEGNPTIKNPVATTTQLLFTKPGFAELVLDAKLVWQQQGETYESDLKPETSGLYAFYPVKGSAQFSKYPQGQLSAGTRHIVFKSFELEIKQQKRIVTTPENAEFADPIQICGSALWPASSPLMVFKATPLIFNAKNNHEIETVKPFVFKTPMEISDKSIELNLGGEFHSDESSPKSGRTVIGKLPAIPVYDENEVLQLRLYPEELVTVYEGQEQTFKAEIEPLPGLGQGIYSGASQNLNVLNGYSVSSVEHVLWYEEPLGDEGDWKTKAERGVDFSHIFNPPLGPGSYTMNCGVVMSLRETDTGDEVPVYLESLVPVDALPGLRIFSPINELAYPLNVSLKVKSSFDKEKNIWKKIKWRLNGKEYNHGLDEGPFYIELNRVGKWSLQAELTIKNPQTNEDMLLKDRVDFTVNPVEIGLTPTRKVLDFDLQKSQKLSLNITLNGKKVEKPGKPVEWGQDGLVALVDPIEWFSATEPDNCATVNSDENNLTTEAGFTVTGATTVLATVTIRLIDGENYFRRRHKGFEDEFEEPVFSFPAVRADLWAIQQDWLSFNGRFPNRAIMGTQRFFHLENGTVKINNRSYTWLTDGIFDETCEIAPALLGAAPLKADRITVEWFAPKNQTSSDFSFKPQFLLDKKTEITLTASIAFGSGDSLKPGEKKYEVSVSPLSDVIDSAVKAVPASVTINKSSAVGLFFGPEDGALLTQNELLVWDGEYQVKLDKVAWLVGVGGLPGVVISPTEANFSFMREHPGEYMVFARPAFEVKAVAEDVQSTRVQLEANPTKIYVSASVVSWFLDPDRMDHLDMLYYLRPDGSPNPVWYYTNKHRIWWNVGIKASVPFVIGCSSYVHLIPEFTEANRPDITRLNYQWLTTDNLPIGNEGIVNCAEGADVPTPDKIGKYHLRLEAEGCDEIVIHTEVYVVQQITADTYKENFFIDCVRNSVAALSGFDKNTDGKTLIDTFFFWWWNSNGQENGNHLEYGAQAWSVKDVILRKGGMCGGLGNYFYKSLKCHGFAGLNRIGFDLLTKNYPVPDSDNKSLDPVTTEYWGAVIYTDPGLNQETMPDNKFTRWPSEISTGTYHLSYANRYTGADKIPPVDIQKVVIDRQLNVEVNTTDRFYMFFAPNDGHALVFYTDSSTQTWLYDPSFGSGKYGAIKVDFPDLGKDTIIKRLGIATNTEIWSYLAKSIGYLRGFTYFKDHNIYKGISVFDIPFNSVNYLKVRFRKYVDYTFSYWGD